VARNINHKNANVKMYEFGDVYSFDHEAERPASGSHLAAYSEHTAMGAWVSGNNHDDSWAEKARPTTVYDLKADLENTLTRLGIGHKELVLEQTDNEVMSPALLYKNRGGKVLATLGVVTDDVLKRFDIDQEVYYAEINWDAVCKAAAKHSVTFTDLPKTLPVRRDLALLVDSAVSYDDVRRVVEQSEKKLLKGVTLFDAYEGKALKAAGKKSYAISITLQDNEKTLQDKQIEAVMKKIVTNLQKQVGAQLR